MAEWSRALTLACLNHGPGEECSSKWCKCGFNKFDKVQFFPFYYFSIASYTSNGSIAIGPIFLIWQGDVCSILKKKQPLDRYFAFQSTPDLPRYHSFWYERINSRLQILDFLWKVQWGHFIAFIRSTIAHTFIHHILFFIIVGRQCAVTWEHRAFTSSRNWRSTVVQTIRQDGLKCNK